MIKLAIITVALVAIAAANDERHFSTGDANQGEFLTTDEDWFHDTYSPKGFLTKVRNATPLVMNAYLGQKEANRMINFYNKLSNQLAEAVNECSGLGGTNNAVPRVRRDERGLLNDLELTGDAMSDMYVVSWGFATYIREALMQNENCDQARAAKWLRRVDRFRQIQEWQYCDKVDDSGEVCAYRYYKNNGQKKPNPRKSALFQTGAYAP